MWSKLEKKSTLLPAIDGPWWVVVVLKRVWGKGLLWTIKHNTIDNKYTLNHFCFPQLYHVVIGTLDTSPL